MLASDFITARDRILNACIRSVISIDDMRLACHRLFVQAQVSRGIEDDFNKADELLVLKMHEHAKACEDKAIAAWEWQK